MLKTRILSALVMLPPAVAAVWVGGPAFQALVALAAALMGWEWDRMVSGRYGAAGMIVSVSAAAAAFLAPAWPAWAAALVAAATLLVLIVGRLRGDAAWSWQAVGAPYVGVPVVALAWLREAGDGLATIMWLLVVVWATDIGAYAAGRSIGGPKLVPRLSPKKTWAGLVGGMACAAAVGAAAAAVVGLPPAGLALLSGALAVVAQAGDIGESAVKRRFGVKDSSTIIPGHGGVLDRVDGVLPVATVVALAAVIQGGGISAWR